MKSIQNYTTCEQCNHRYDVYLNKCPHCKKQNNHRPSFYYRQNMDWLPIVRQILLIVIGYGGLQLLSLILSVIVSVVVTTNVYSANPDLLYEELYDLILEEISSPYYSMLLNTLCYVIILACIIAITFPYLVDIFKKFANYKNVLFGVVGFIVLFVFSMLYSSLISLVYQTEGNNNQTSIVSLVEVYPIICLIIFGFIGPIVEEFAYRVGLFNVLYRLKNKWLAYLITALIFGFIHFDFTATDMVNELINIPDYIISGLILCYIYQKWGYAGSLTTHALNNIVAVLIVIIAY